MKVTELLDKKVEGILVFIVNNITEFTFLDPVYKVKYTDPVLNAVQVMIEHKAHRFII